jgi:DNA-binding transcriptional ArsR family regulator
MSAKEQPEESSGKPGGDRVVVTITDPLAIRALAHKVRLEVIDEFFSSKRAHTATELAGRFGLTPSAMSYHLRALEKWGYVVRVESSGDGRERYWRAAGDTLNVGSLAMASELISSSFIDVTLSTARDRVVRALTSIEGMAEADKPVFMVSNSKFLLTKKQSEDFAAEFEELAERYRKLGEAAEADPAVVDTRPMHVTMMFVPEVPPAKE